MESRILATPSANAVSELLTECHRRNACLSLYARCAVTYDGRAESELNTGDRLVVIKSDQAILVHGETKLKPRNWQPPGASIKVSDTDPLIITGISTDPTETLEIAFEDLYHATIMPMDDDAEVKLSGSEADLQDHIFNSPGVIEQGFRSEAKEYETPAGPVDIWGYDADGNPVIVELKRRRAGLDAVSQLRRYVDSTMADVRGVLAAPSITGPAEQLLVDFGLESREIDPPPMDTAPSNRSLSEYTDASPED